MSQPAAEEAHPHRYDAALAERIELKWQDYWDANGTWHAPNPAGPLAGDTGGREKLYVLDMFPYPSNAGLHVGHPLGYIGTDVWARFQRMQGRNVLHTLGYDAFGLPAEQFAVQTGQHPRVTTEQAIANYKRQLRRLGLAHDPRRAVATTDVAFYRWTQWIFLQIFNAWYDPEQRRARPIGELVAEYESGARTADRPWSELTDVERRTVIDDHRLAYRAEAMVNWCPGLGTVLANEEVTPDGRSERGNFPVFRRPLTQWMMRITAYADRLIDDLETIEWPDKVKRMQRNWIGRSEGARAVFTSGDVDIEVFTTRPDTLFGATYVVLAPEHPLVDRLVTDEQRAAVEAYRRQASQLSELDRQVESRTKTGVYVGADAVNPVNGERVPVWIADYVLLGYGTGAIMAVPAHDARDHEFATTFGLPIRQVVTTPDGWPAAEAYTGEGVAVNSGFLDGLDTATAKKRIGQWLEEQGRGRPAITYKLRDWLFSRQRYWGEPFPIVYDETGLPVALPESMLPVELPDVDDYAPRIAADDDTSAPEPPLGRAEQWATVELDLGDGPRTYRRELNTMPQWAGSCWYYLRYLDPTNDERFVDPEVERYWMNVDLYVGGVEHAVLHLLYARFWHKVLYDLGHLSSSEPFQRLFNQGYVLAPAFTDERGVYVDAASVEEREDGTFAYQGRPVTRHTGKMGKSLKNSVSPDDVYREYGADTMRLYEMATGPLDSDRPWSTTDIVGVHRLLQRIWRAVVDEETGELRVTDDEPDAALLRETHRAVAKVTEEMAGLRFNTAIARVTELANAVTKAGSCPRQTAETITLLIAPLAPHLAEELWQRLGHEPSVGRQPFPVADETLLAEADVTCVVQVNGKVRDRLTVPADADEAALEAAALASGKVVAALAGKPVRKVIARPPALVNIVV